MFAKIGKVKVTTSSRVKKCRLFIIDEALDGAVPAGGNTQFPACWIIPFE